MADGVVDPGPDAAENLGDTGRGDAERSGNILLFEAAGDGEAVDIEAAKRRHSWARRHGNLRAK